jgi:hypothetical protein
MSKYYSVIREGKERWISMPNNGGELVQCPLEIMEELNRLIHQRDEANERIKRLEEAGDRLAAFTPPSADRIAQWKQAKEAKP